MKATHLFLFPCFIHKQIPTHKKKIKKNKKKPDSFDVEFRNHRLKDVTVWWDDGADGIVQDTIQSGGSTDINTFKGTLYYFMHPKFHKITCFKTLTKKLFLATKNIAKLRILFHLQHTHTHTCTCMCLRKKNTM